MTRTMITDLPTTLSREEMTQLEGALAACVCVGLAFAGGLAIGYRTRLEVRAARAVIGKIVY